MPTTPNENTIPNTINTSGTGSTSPVQNVLDYLASFISPSKDTSSKKVLDQDEVEYTNKNLENEFEVAAVYGPQRPSIEIENKSIQPAMDIPTMSPFGPEMTAHRYKLNDKFNLMMIEAYINLLTQNMATAENHALIAKNPAENHALLAMDAKKSKRVMFEQLHDDTKGSYKAIRNYNLIITGLIILTCATIATGFIPMVPALIGIGITLLVTNAANLYALHKLHNKVVAKNMDLETKPNLGILSDALMTNLVIALGIGIVAAAFFFAPPSVVLVAAALISILPLINSNFVLKKHAKIIADKVHKIFDKSPLELKSSEHFEDNSNNASASDLSMFDNQANANANETSMVVYNKGYNA